MEPTEPRDDAPQDGEQDGGEEARPLPSFPRRILDVFFSPGRLGEALARRPVWGAALAFGAVLVAAQSALIPVEVFEAAVREAAAASGGQVPEGASMGTLMRISGTIGGFLFWLIYTFLMAGVVTVLFAFFMGDEGRYRQYLAMVAHALLIPAIVGVALVPLRIAQQDPQLTLNLSSFFFFVEEGYLYRVLRLTDLSGVWAWLVVAQGVHAIDRRRSFGSAALVLVGLSVVLALIFATFVPVT